MSPVCRAAISHEAGGRAPQLRPLKSSLSNRCKCACMHGNVNTSSTYNRASIIASLLDGREKKKKNNLRPQLADTAAESGDVYAN